MNTKDCREDNVTVACWFVDRMLDAYAAECVKGKYSNLRLAGFYWQQENGNIHPFMRRLRWMALPCSRESCTLMCRL